MGFLVRIYMRVFIYKAGKNASTHGKKPHVHRVAGMVASVRGKKPHIYRVIILKQMADHTTRDVFNCLFPLDVQNELQLLLRVFCYSWLVCLLGFWLKNTSHVKVGNLISDGIVIVFHLA